MQDATSIESNFRKHGKKTPSVPVDPLIPEMTKDIKADRHRKDEFALDAKRRMTKEKKRQAKIRNARMKRLSWGDARM